MTFPEKPMAVPYVGGGSGVYGVECKGSWMLGTACGDCQRCHENARALIPKLIESRRELSQLLKQLRMHLPAPVEGADFADHVKAVLFDEARGFVANLSD